MAKSEKNDRLGQAKEMAAAWESFSKGNTHQARIEARKVLETPSAAADAKMEASDLLERTSVDRAHLFAAILVGCVWLTIAAIVYLR